MLFLLYHQKIFIPYIFGHSSSQSVLQWNSFSPLKYIVYKCYSCFRPGMGHFLFSSSHLSTLVALLFCCIIKTIYPIYCFGHSSSQSVLQWNSFSPLKYIVYKCYSCFRPGMGHFFFIVTLVYTCLHLSCFFCYIIRKYLSHIFLVTVRLSLFHNEILFFFFSFKIHCLKMLQLFQTRDGPIFFIVILVYTCPVFFFFFFFAVSSENTYPIYCFGHSSSQSVLQWNSFSLLKYIVYKCYSCFRPRMGQFFSSSHVSTLVALFCCIIRKCLSHILFWSQLVSVCFAIKFFFFSFKIHCLQMFQMFQTRDGPIFSSSRLFTLVTIFSLYHQKNVYPIYCFGHSSSQSVLHWNSFSPLKYIVYKCYICFRPEMCQLFSSSHLSILVALFLLYHQKIFVPSIVLVTARLSLFRNEILFFL